MLLARRADSSVATPSYSLMKTPRLLLLALVSLCALPGLLLAQGGGKPGEKKAPQKSEADLAVEEFYKIRDAKDAKQGQPHFQKVIMAGIGVLEQHAAHRRSVDVVNDLGNFASKKLPLTDKALAPLRAVFVSQLQYETLNARYKESLSEEAKAAIAALTASAADAEARDNLNKQTLETLREKIDALAEVPGAGRFLAARERSFFQILAFSSPARGEEFLRRLVEHPVKPVADMAKAELAVIEVKKEPIALKFNGLDGIETDLGKMRGKIVAVYFWASSNSGSTRNFEHLKVVANDYKKRGLEVVTISLDKADDRAKLEKYVKDSRINFPVYFDGKGSRTELAAKLGAGAGQVVAFDQAGMLVGDSSGHLFQVAQLEPIAKLLLTPKKKK